MPYLPYGFCESRGSFPKSWEQRFLRRYYWQKACLQTEAGENKITPSKFVAKFDKKYLADYKEVRDARRDRNGYTLIDARPVEFFKGEKKFATIERAGTIPNAKNLQESALIDTNSSINQLMKLNN